MLPTMQLCLIYHIGVICSYNELCMPYARLSRNNSFAGEILGNPVPSKRSFLLSFYQFFSLWVLSHSGLFFLSIYLSTSSENGRGKLQKKTISSYDMFSVASKSNTTKKFKHTQAAPTPGPTKKNKQVAKRGS
ncbi:hypothetical protein CIPAW_05G036300 [Carya illinoinensis]|uniref:Uncharacterized protein n=1 Tax=Carya illinoinensis TaxID=32201 RepID=A0A8T1QER8_CARIL|nr:hypothetical protein CIPAW_05G036300 [Carya illinoinensis]